MTQRNKGLTQQVAATTTCISVRSGRRIEKGLWQQVGERHWRTRNDPLAEVWSSDIIPLLTSRPQISPVTVFEHFQDKYPGQYPDIVRRTLQRRIRTWKACHGEEKEVMFRQEYQPGLSVLSNFTQLRGTEITINGRPLEHKLFHFRLEWSRWSWMRVVTGGECFSALAEGGQEALAQLGSVPQEHRTDSLSDAWKNLSEDGHRDLTEPYAHLCEHNGMIPSRNNSGCCHENGSVESAYTHLKQRIRQELEVLKPLPKRRCADYEELSVRASSTINVWLVVYSVPSRVIGQMLKVRLWDDRLSCYVGSEEVMSCRRVRPARSIDFRHVMAVCSENPTRSTTRRYVMTSCRMSNGVISGSGCARASVLNWPADSCLMH